MILKDKVALVTGASRGIGKSIAYKLAAEGVKVVVNGTEKTLVERVVADIHQSGGRAIGSCQSIETMDGGKRILEQCLDGFGTVDILINNAGIIRDGMSYRLTEEDWDQVIDVHLKGTFSCTQPVIQYLRKVEKEGHIINMTSTAGLLGSFGQVNYSAAKAGILGLTWTLALELAKYHIRVNAVAPAALTDMTRPVIEKVKKEAKQKQEPFPDEWKIGQPEDVAEFIVALCQMDQREMTGQVFSVNGGRIGRWNGPSYEPLLANETGQSAQYILEGLSEKF